tara:strand:- start:1012 stop:1527 length:516 start_codon:yes stop_codon:yes gene_type:complete
MSISLDSSIRTCKVETGEASRIQSDRFQNHNLMVCPPWTGYDLTGRSVCADSFYTKSPGCNSATDRVNVENFLRPQYAPYITLNMSGLDGDIYAKSNVNSYVDAKGAQQFDNSRNNLTGNYGLQWRANNKYTACTNNAYSRAMAEVAHSNRVVAQSHNGFKGNNNRSCSGN